MALTGANSFPKEWIGRYYRNHICLGMTLGDMLNRSADLYRKAEIFSASRFLDSP